MGSIFSTGGQRGGFSVCFEAVGKILDRLSLLTPRARLVSHENYNFSGRTKKLFKKYLNGQALASGQWRAIKISESRKNHSKLVNSRWKALKTRKPLTNNCYYNPAQAEKVIFAGNWNFRIFGILPRGDRFWQILMDYWSSHDFFKSPPSPKCIIYRILKF